MSTEYLFYTLGWKVMKMNELKKRQDKMKKLFRMATRKDFSPEFKRSILDLNPSVEVECKEVQQDPEVVYSADGRKKLLDMDRFNDNFSREFGV